jgi:hypothetical protein
VRERREREQKGERGLAYASNELRGELSLSLGGCNLRRHAEDTDGLKRTHAFSGGRTRRQRRRRRRRRRRRHFALAEENPIAPAYTSKLRARARFYPARVRERERKKGKGPIRAYAVLVRARVRGSHSLARSLALFLSYSLCDGSAARARALVCACVFPSPRCARQCVRQCVCVSRARRTRAKKIEERASER